VPFFRHSVHVYFSGISIRDEYRYHPIVANLFLSQVTRR